MVAVNWSNRAICFLGCFFLLNPRSMFWRVIWTGNLLGNSAGEFMERRWGKKQETTTKNNKK